MCSIGDLPLFRLARVSIAGCKVHVLRHSMVSTIGLELSGPYAEGAKVRDTLLAAGQKYGIKLVGLKPTGVRWQRVAG
jgi:vanillate/3-O-methylgallate O-demethylase